MESYPGELLVGVFPLVFCVDATLKDAASEELTKDAETKKPADSNVNDFDNPPDENFSLEDDATKANKNSSNRTQFDRFLDAIAAALLESEDDPLSSDANNPTPQRRKPEDVMMSLFRGDDFDSDEEDELLLSNSSRSLLSPGPSIDAMGFGMDDSASKSRLSGGYGKRTFRGPPSIGIGFRLGRNTRASPLTVGGSGSSSGSNLLGLNTSNPNASANNPVFNTSYAKALKHGQGFFQRARLISISTRHGFPPSKDPEGHQNRIEQFFDGKTLRSKKILTAVNKTPLDGILPSGWLEKHCHALPSVLMIVVRASMDKKQPEQDKILEDTLKNVQYSLARKRACKIHVVGLVQDGVSFIQAEQWSQSLAEKIDGHIEISLLDMADIMQSSVASAALKQLHKTVRDSSLSYYLALARRTKAKLQRLGEARQTPVLLPLTIRYCFKVAVFYEFQWNHEKSVRFMAEAYRHAETYFRYLVQLKINEQLRSGDDGNQSSQKEDTPDEKTDGDTKDPVKIFPPSVSHALVAHASSAPSSHGTNSTEDEGESVELTLRSQTEEDLFDLTPPIPPDDMVYQCRAVADWLNFKILNAGFTSHTEGGLHAAAAQWQKHVQAFCNSRKSFVSPEPWTDWAYVAHQRVVVSQLLERHPPRALGDLGNKYDEVLLRCSPWRTYEAASEALLKLGAAVRRARENQTNSGTELKKMDDLRTRYVGGLDNEGFTPQLQEEIKTDHREQALDCILRAISLFEHELEKEKAKDDENHFREHSWSRSGARMYYLAGGILLGMERHSEATPYLEKAVTYAKGWSELELRIRRMLIECYEKKMPSQADAAQSSQTIASMILDSYFNAEMSNNNLRRALENFSSLSGVDALKWRRECMDEADSSLPFSFALTFPSTTHATVGDAVHASVFIKSNLDYAVHVNSVTMLSFAGPISIPSNDLLGAKNADEGSDGGIIIQANTEILISTQIELPRDLDSIAIDESGNGGEKEGVAGKGSFAKSARPRTAGITSAAGARLVSEKDFDQGIRAETGQWSVRFLGGKPLRCDGMCLVFYPVYVGTATKNCEIELTIKKRQPKTAVNIKRTPFEGDNYIASAWSRPRHLPLCRGPRCLRVLAPMADLLIKNVTESYTNGKVIEGTVNRILLKLQAGPQELCTDLRMRVSCSSLVITLDGNTKRIVSQSQENDLTEDMTNPSVRTPVLVSRDPNATSHQTEYGYALPDGWVLFGNGQGSQEESSLVAQTLKSGESTFVYFDLYRPSPKVTRMEGVLQVGDESNDFVCERDMCQTDFDVAISYRQERPAQQMKRMPVRRRNRGASSPKVENKADLVMQEFSGSVMWSAPISAIFSAGIKDMYPCGNRHPSNFVPDPESGNTPTRAPQPSEMVLIDGERVTTKCVLEAVAAADGLSAEIQRVGFDENLDEKIPCHLSLVTETTKGSEGVLYEAQKDDPGSKLLLGAKLSLAWTTEVKMEKGFLKGSVSAPLGLISVAWSPIPIELPQGVTTTDAVNPITAHGPLPLAKPSTCSFLGPPCYIESAPFKAVVETFPSTPKVATPFDVVYRITNKTYVEQKLKIRLADPDPTSTSIGDTDGILISGISNGELSMSPFETHALCYTALVTKAGKVVMPKISVSSDRYKTWVINEDSHERRTLFVVP